MQVLSYGAGWIPWSAVVACTQCRSRLRLDGADVRYANVGTDPAQPWLYAFTCAVCAGTVAFAATPEWPDAVLAAARTAAGQ